MSWIAFVLIFISAVLHASWNLMAKKNHMTPSYYLSMTLVGIVLFGHIVFWTPVQYSQLSDWYWVWLLVSVLSDSVLYNIGICKSYELSEMSSAYPIMRSLPIIFTALITTIFGLGMTLTPSAMLGMGIVTIGCIVMPMIRFSDFRHQSFSGKARLFILLTALGTTGYTIGDSLALSAIFSAQPDVSSAMRSLSYYATRSMGLNLCLFIFSMSTAANRADFHARFSHFDWHPIVSGIMATATYSIVLIAMNFVTNVSYVQVFRQIGLPVGMIAGILFLKERFTLPKVVGMTLILIGLVMTVF